ncbi:MAG TPA: ATP-binding protein [bacterium]|nr:ATP-binding protein [bacterium]
MKLRIRTRLLLWFGGLTIVLQLSFHLFTFEHSRGIMSKVLDDLLLTRAMLILENGLAEPARPTPLGRDGARVQLIVVDDSGMVVAAPQTSMLPLLTASRLAAMQLRAGQTMAEHPGPGPGPSPVRWIRELLPFHAGPPADPERRPMKLMPLPVPAGGMQLDSAGVCVTAAAFFNYHADRKENYRFVALNYRRGGRGFTAFVGEPFDTADDGIMQMQRMLEMAIPVFLMIVILGSYVIVRLGLRPLRRTIAEARTMSGSEPGRRMAVPDTNDEVAELVLTVNGLLGRIEEAHAQLRQFTSDAAHELRTPLAAIKNQVQIARRRTRTPGEYGELLGSLEEDIKYMEHMLGGLLLLARLDRGKVEMSPESLSLNELLRELAVEPAFAALPVTFAGSSPLTVVAYRPLLEQLMRNLLVNAQRYGGDQARITIATRLEHGRACVSVADNGPGVPADSLPHLFDRFYKVESAHSNREGVGLGLSIVRAIARFHGGDATARNGETGGLIVEF